MFIVEVLCTALRRTYFMIWLVKLAFFIFRSEKKNNISATPL